MDDRRLNSLLKWSVENSDVTRRDPAASAAASSNRTELTPELMAALMGGPSDADLMKASMQIVAAPPEEASLEEKLVAFDNFEQLIESLDNANNIANLGLWTPLLEQLQNEEADIRKMAAWCIGTAVQNNLKTQERLYAMGGVKTLTGLATAVAEKEDVRRKAVYALSSACRNYQPAMDVCMEELGAEKVDATDMGAVDVVMDGLREKAKAGL
ncbi:hsp70 nucleotide exchange factor fes1 [Claviceps spartinae]|nr:hsp70 nucleotide exchange factor fes1 [Claviceps spartinae]